ncbi:hypothetical protein ACOZCI_20740 [Streptomyces griseoincarnatus]
MTADPSAALARGGTSCPWPQMPGVAMPGDPPGSAARELKVSRMSTPVAPGLFDQTLEEIGEQPEHEVVYQGLCRRDLAPSGCFELDLVALVQAAAAWAAETGSAGGLVLSAAPHGFDDSDKPVHLITSEHAFTHGPATPFPAVPVQTTGELSAIVTDQREAVVVACALVSDLLADMGAHEPHVLIPEGEILMDRLEGFRHTLRVATGLPTARNPGP